MVPEIKRKQVSLILACSVSITVGQIIPAVWGFSQGKAGELVGWRETSLSRLLRIIFLKSTALLRCNLQTIKFTFLKCTIQCCLKACVHKIAQPSTLLLEHLHHVTPERDSDPLGVTPTSFCGRRVEGPEQSKDSQAQKVTRAESPQVPSKGLNWESTNLAPRVSFPPLAYPGHVV